MELHKLVGYKDASSGSERDEEGLVRHFRQRFHLGWDLRSVTSHLASLCTPIPLCLSSGTKKLCTFVHHLPLSEVGVCET